MKMKQRSRNQALGVGGKKVSHRPIKGKVNQKVFKSNSPVEQERGCARANPK